jgi:hypothetical protein
MLLGQQCWVRLIKRPFMETLQFTTNYKPLSKAPVKQGRELFIVNNHSLLQRFKIQFICHTFYKI